MVRRRRQGRKGWANDPRQDLCVLAKPVRRCVVCRQRASGTTLIRLSLEGGQIIVSPAGGGGRGAYVCAAQGCLSKLRPVHVVSALRQGGPRPKAKDGTGFVANLHAVAERRLLETIGLARRSGALEFGIDRLGRGGRPSQSDGVLLVSSDLTEGSRRGLGESVRLFVGGDRMGRAAGLGHVKAMRFRPGRLADRAAYWYGVWYETWPQTSPGGSGGGGMG